jgi:cell division transport system permease protein
MAGCVPHEGFRIMSGLTGKPGKIIPPEAAPLRNLTATMAVMCYLACLAIGALILIDRAVDGWTRGLSREITVQIRETKSSDMTQKLDAAKILLGETRGITAAEILDREAGIKLLEPWLGKSSLDSLPVPRLIRVIVDPDNPPDFAELEAKLKQSIDGAALDTHQRWAAELSRMAGTLSTVSWLILLLICGSAIAMVIFATHAVLDANEKTVSVLHLVGARDGYIARQIDRRFLATGAWAGCIGVALALLTFLLMSLSGNPAANALAAASKNLLYAPDGSSYRIYLALLAVPPVAIVIALVTSRITLMQMLRQTQ